MMDFETAVELLLSPNVEGGYSNNRMDPGGETMWGITKRDAFKHGYTGDMRYLPKATAKEIYKAEYWDPLHSDDMPDRFRYPFFDCGVNEGVERATEFLHSFLGLEEGPIDQATLVAVGMADITSLVCYFMALRVRHYTSLPTWGMFGRGWMNRVATNLEIVANKEAV